MTRDRAGAGANSARIVAAIVLLVEIAWQIEGWMYGMRGLIPWIVGPFALLLGLVQSLVVAPAWCVGLLTSSDRSALRRRRAIAQTLLLSAATLCVTLSTWYFAYHSASSGAPVGTGG